jgi:hypothetical protein
VSGAAVTKRGRCKHCGRRLEQGTRGRPRQFCPGGVCKQADFRLRHSQREMTPDEWRRLARAAINDAKRHRIEAAGGYRALERAARELDAQADAA